MDCYQLVLDDSGTRCPDRRVGRKPAHGYDWFGLGGILVREGADIKQAKRLHEEFMVDWSVRAPLHSSEIRGMHKNFNFLKGLRKAERARFYEELYQLMAKSPLLGLACVIDRPGYNARYEKKYGRQKWSLCKTSFSIVVERAAKFARLRGAKLRVYAERSDKMVDAIVKGYYEDMRSDGMPFGKDNSGKYSPLTAAELHETLYEFRTKQKSSPMVQLADLYMWPMCIAGYDGDNRPFRRLKEDGKLLDCLLTEEEAPHLGTKYSCFELQKSKSPA